MLARYPIALTTVFFVVGACSASPSSGGGRGPGGSGGAGGATGGSAGSSAGSSGSIGVGGTGATTGGTGGTGISLDAGGGTAGTPGVGGTAGMPGVGGSTGGGCGQAPPGDQPVPEVCGDGLDNDLNGFVDEQCDCVVGQSQPCFGGYPSQANDPVCVMGMQTCTGTAEFHGWGPCENWMCGTVPPPDEICDNMIDDDCDGLIDEGCGLTVPVQINGDCLFAACPPQAPFPIGCQITFAGGDGRGCVSTAAGNGMVYFQEGDACCLPPPLNFDCGNVMGTLLCSTQPGPGLNEMNCPMNKQQALYPTSGGPPRWGCP